jgi:hypothetical protein
MSPSEAQLHDALHEGEGDGEGLDVAALIAHAIGVRRARQRRRTVVAGGLAVAGLGAVGLTTLGGHGGTSGRTASGAGSAVTTPVRVKPHVRGGPPHVGPITPNGGNLGELRTCQAADLQVQAHAIRARSTTYLIALRSLNGAACTILGYPTVAVTGRHTDQQGTADGPVRHLTVDEQYGDVNGHPDPGPSAVVLSSTSVASCYLTIGESGSSGRVLDRLRDLTISLPGMYGTVAVDGLHSVLVRRTAGLPLTVVTTAITQ